MKKRSVQAILEGLNDAGVLYLIAGGLAVNAHGVLRFTADVDVVVHLVPDNIRKAFDALGALGYRPIVPVTSEGFADPETRRHMNRRQDPTEEIDWAATTWEGSRRWQLERWAELDLDEILEAQEAMAELAREILDAPPSP